MKDEYKILIALFLLICLLTIKTKEGLCSEIAFEQCAIYGCAANNNTKRCIDPPIDCSKINVSTDINNYTQCFQKDLCIWNNGKCINDLCVTYGPDVCLQDPKCELLNNWCVVKR
uniref:Uncharacterized protein n=1 Tax=viral metagenome TaxID=1070528 RepID=A0A6C0EW15_9ZZZZ